MTSMALDLFRNAGKLVLTADYATAPAHVDDACASATAKGTVLFVTVRDLDRLTGFDRHRLRFRRARSWRAEAGTDPL